MSNAQEAAPAPKKGRRMNKIVLILVCLLCTAAGAAVPWVAYGSSKGKTEDAGHDASSHGASSHGSSGGHGDGKEGKSHAGKYEFVAFGDVVVNLHEERMTRYLRVKIVLMVDGGKEKIFTDHMNASKAQLKNWLIGHLANKSLKDVGGSVGVKRLQREILEHFETVLYPEGDGPLREVLFEEYAVQ